MSEVLVLFASVAGATFFAASERHFLTSEQMRLRRWVRDTVRGGRSEHRRAWLSPEDRLGPVRAGQAIAIAGAAGSAAALVLKFVPGPPVVSAALSSIAIAPILYILGDVLPRAVSQRQLQPPPRASERFLRGIVWLLRPVSELADRVALAISRKITGSIESERHAGTDRVLAEGERGGLVDRGEREIMAGVFEFGSTGVEDIMTPVEKMAAAESDATAGRIAAIVRRTGFSRIPIRGRQSGSVIGMVHVLDLFRVASDRQPAVRPVMTCDAATPCDRLLRQMRRERRHLSVVRREGSVVGMVTLEDLVEELVGDIRDEHDVQPETSRRAFVVDGQMTIAEISSARGIELPSSRETTVAGFVIERLGRIPHVGDTIVFRGWTIDVLDATPQRIRKVRFRRRTPIPSD